MISLLLLLHPPAPPNGWWEAGSSDCSLPGNSTLVMKTAGSGWPFLVSQGAHLLNNKRLDMKHLSGGLIISGSEKCSLTLR